MKEIIIEWQHLDVDGKTCTRCGDTGENIKNVLKKISSDFELQGFKFIFKETKLDDTKIPESNKVFIDGILIEDIIPELKITKNACPSCSELLGKETCCRAVEYKGKISDEISAELIKKALYIVAEKESN